MKKRTAENGDGGVRSRFDIELSPPGGFLDKDLCIAEIGIGTVIASHMVGLRQSDPADDALDIELPERTGIDDGGSSGLQMSCDGRGCGS